MGAQATGAYVDRAVCFPFIQFAGEMQESLEVRPVGVPGMEFAKPQLHTDYLEGGK